jgi:hypothetical protein
VALLCCGLVSVDTADICSLAWFSCAVGLWPTGTAAVTECSGWSTVVACRVMARLTVALQSERAGCIAGGYIATIVDMGTAVA